MKSPGSPLAWASSSGQSTWGSRAIQSISAKATAGSFSGCAGCSGVKSLCDIPITLPRCGVGRCGPGLGSIGLGGAWTDSSYIAGPMACCCAMDGVALPVGRGNRPPPLKNSAPAFIASCITPRQDIPSPPPSPIASLSFWAFSSAVISLSNSSPSASFFGFTPLFFKAASRYCWRYSGLFSSSLWKSRSS